MMAARKHLGAFAAMLAVMLAVAAISHSVTHLPLQGERIACAICETPVDSATPSALPTRGEAPPLSVEDSPVTTTSLGSFETPNARSPPTA